MQIRENYPLKTHNTFGIEVNARWFVEYDAREELERLLRDEYFRECKSFHIGSGSNLLFLNDYQGIILHTAIDGIEVRRQGDDVLLRVGAGVLWDDVVDFVLQQGWGGPENLSLIPGEVGAAAVQNIGAYGAEVKDFIHAVEAIDRHTARSHTFAASDCHYRYRYSRFKDEGSPFIITHVVFRFAANPPPPSLTRDALLAGSLPPAPSHLDVRQAVIRLRRSKLPDPRELGNAGSFFMNPVVDAGLFAHIKATFPDIPHYPAGQLFKIPAAWLIEQCGFKGFRQGDAGVCDRQALVLVNHGKATGADIAWLAETIVHEVHSRFSIRLTPEVKYVPATASPFTPATPSPFIPTTPSPFTPSTASPFIPRVFSGETTLQTSSFRLVIRCADAPLRLRERFRITLRDGILTVLCPPRTAFESQDIQTRLHTILHNALRSEARRLLPARLSSLAGRHGFIYQAVKINSARTRWGSCSGKKVINLSCFLLLLPEHLIDYVLLHELCHTQQMNHGPAFWTLLNQVTSASALRLRHELNSLPPLLIPPSKS